MQDEMGLGWYEYGARVYDPVLGRFPSLDPIADSFAFVSPYNYAENEPVSCIDLLGLQKYRLTSSFSMTTGKIGGKISVFGLGLGGTYAKGAAAETIFVTLEYDQESLKFDASIGYKQEIILDEGSGNVGPFHGGESTKKETIRTLSFQNGSDKIDDGKYFTEEFGGVGFISTTEKDGSSKTSLKAEQQINAFFIGLEASQSFEYIEKKEE